MPGGGQLQSLDQMYVFEAVSVAMQILISSGSIPRSLLRFLF